jgi:hypothetical protein
VIFRSPVRAVSRPFTCHSGGRGLDDKRVAGDERSRVLNAHEPLGLAFSDLASEATIELQIRGAFLEGLADVRWPHTDGRRQARARAQHHHHGPTRSDKSPAELAVEHRGRGTEA